MDMINIKLKLKQIWEKYQLAILIALASFIVSVIAVVLYKFLLQPKISLEHFSNSVYTVQYDSTWNLDKKENDKVSLKHDDATINIEITTLTNDYLYMTLENIIDEISYSISQANPNYYLIGKQNILVTANQYEGYQLLYENGENQVLLTLFRRENKIVSIIYEAPYEYFDILLDSVKEIIYNFKLANEEYANSHSLLEIESKELSLNGNDEVEVAGTKNYQIADSHYLVEFRVPDKFTSRTFNARLSLLIYNELSEGNIDLTASIYDINLYEMLEKLKNHSFDYSIESAIQSNRLIKEEFTKVNANQYIYHAIYTSGISKYDVAYLIFELDYRRVFVVKLEASNCYLDESIINNISIVNKTKYADYVYRNIEDGFLVNEMKYAYTDYQDYKRKYSRVILYTPSNYREQDDGVSNVYENRTFNDNFNEDSGDYDFKVRYSISSLNIKSNLNVLEHVYYDKKDKSGLGTKIYNGKKFNVYTYNSKNKYVHVLFYKLESGNCFQIVIESNGGRITNDKIKELTKFEESIYVMN